MTAYRSLGRYTTNGHVHVTTGQQPRRHHLSDQIDAIAINPNGHRHWGYATVDYRVPVDVKHVPMVLIPGGGLDASTYATTPDGRPGWMVDFAGFGWPVHAVDPPERGRTAWLPEVAPYDQPPLLRTYEQTWLDFRLGTLPEGEWERREPFQGSQFPYRYLPEALRYSVPRWTATRDLAVEAIREIVSGLGRCVLLGHSWGGGIALDVAHAEPNHVVATVAVEPHGGLTAPEAPAGPVLWVRGDFIEQAGPLWIDLDRGWRTYQDAARRAGHRIDLMDLAGRGLPGVTHMPMWDLSSAAIAALVADWLAAVPATSALQRDNGFS